jgi:hypothetical protein
MKINSVVKKDVGDARKIKGRAYKVAYKAMYKHLGAEENRSLHGQFYGNEDEPLQRLVEARDGEQDFGSSIGNLLKVRTQYQWVNGAWLERIEERVELSMEEKLLVAKLRDEQLEGVANHVVSSINKEKDRDAAREKENPNYEFNVGDWCIIRQDITEEPFFVGRINGMKTDENDICKELHMQECGSEESRKEKKKCLPNSKYKLRWQKEIEVDVDIEGKKVRKKVKIDQYTSGNQRGEAGFKMVLSVFDPRSVVEWGKREKIVRRDGSLTSDAMLSISANERVQWKSSHRRAPAVSSLSLSPESFSSASSSSASSSSASSSSSSSSSASRGVAAVGQLEFVD